MNLSSIYFNELAERADELDEAEEAIERLKKETEGQDLREFELREKFEEHYLWEKTLIWMRSINM